jgi:hypothetical protein
MKKNKILSLILALAMAFSLAAPAFASDSSTTSKDVEITSKLQDQVVKITMEAAPKAVLNPYGLGYASRSDTISLRAFDQVASKDNLIISQSTVPLNIAVSVSEVSTENDVILADEDWTGNDVTDRQVFMYAVFKALDTSKLTKTSDPSIAAALADQTKFYPTDDITGNHVAIDYPTGNALVFEKTENKAANAVKIPAEVSDDAEPQVVAQLAATNTTMSGTGSAATYDSKTISAVAYKMSGHMVEEPQDDEGAAAPWSAADQVKFKLAFSFNPAKADTRQQALWAFGDFDIDLQSAYEVNPSNRDLTISIDDFNLYGLSAYKTDYAYALSLRLPDVAKLDEAPTVGDASGKSGNIQEWHGGSSVSTAWADITGKTADVAHYTADTTSPDGFVTIELEDLRAAAIGVADLSKVLIPLTLKCKLPTGASGAMEEATYNLKLVANVSSFVGTNLTHAAKADPATLNVAGMKGALGTTNDPASVNLISAKGQVSAADITVNADGSVSILAAKLANSGEDDTYVTMELSYKDGADGAVQVKSIDFKAPGQSS